MHLKELALVNYLLIVLPIYSITKNKKSFPLMVFNCLNFVCLLYFAFSFFEYLAYGKLLKEPLITSNLGNFYIVHVFKAIFSINMIVSYTL